MSGADALLDEAACAVIQAEFPDCHLLASFAVFDVNPDDNKGNLPTNWESQAQRWAKASKVEFDHPRSKVEHLRPVVA